MNPVGKAVASPLGFHPASDDPALRCQWRGGGNTEGRAPGQGSTGTLQPSLPAPVLSVGLLLCWPWRVFLAASFGVLCALPVLLWLRPPEGAGCGVQPLSRGGQELPKVHGIGAWGVGGTKG